MFKVAKRAGVPTSRIMPMRWVLTWETIPDETKAKARLVVKGFTDPDLIKLRAEAPTLSKIWSTSLTATWSISQVSF